MNNIWNELYRLFGDETVSFLNFRELLVEAMAKTLDTGDKIGIKRLCFFALDPASLNPAILAESKKLVIILYDSESVPVERFYIDYDPGSGLTARTRIDAVKISESDRIKKIRDEYSVNLFLRRMRQGEILWTAPVQRPEFVEDENPLTPTEEIEIEIPAKQAEEVELRIRLDEPEPVMLTSDDIFGKTPETITPEETVKHSGRKTEKKEYISEPPAGTKTVDERLNLRDLQKRQKPPFYKRIFMGRNKYYMIGMGVVIVLLVIFGKSISSFILGTSALKEEHNKPAVTETQEDTPVKPVTPAADKAKEKKQDSVKVADSTAVKKAEEPKKKPAEKEKTPAESKPKTETPKPSTGTNYNVAGDKRFKGDNIFTDGNLYTVQYAAYLEEGQANDAKKKLAARGYNAFVLEKVINGKNYYRVRVGPYDSADEASSVAAKLK